MTSEQILARAIALWQTAHPDRPMAIPDHTDLCCWLMDRLLEVSDLLSDLAASGVEFQDQRLHYVVVQIAREDWKRLQDYVHEVLR